MISSQDEEVLWIFDFVCQQKADGLQGLFTSIHIIAEKEVVCFRREAAVLKEPEEIIVLPMNVAADLTRLVSELIRNPIGQESYLDRSFQL